MWKTNLYRGHCSDELLLAHSDGELSGREQRAVSEHLEACWHCRARQAALEEQIRALVERFDQLGVPSPVRIAEAKVRLMQCREEFGGRGPETVYFALLGRGFAKTAVVAVCVMVCVAGLASWHYVMQSRPRLDPSRPPAPAANPVLPKAATVPLTAVPIPALTPPSPAAPPTEAELRAKEVELLYALHRLHACLGEPVEVIRLAHGGLLVRGLLSSRERKAELLAALNEVDSPEWVTIDLKTFHEASGTEEPGGSATPPAETSPVTFGTESLYFQDRLRSYFARQGARMPDEEVTEFANRAVSLSDLLLSEAWALRRLVELFTAEERQPLDFRSLWLVEVMLRDHLSALREQGRNARLLLEPVLSAVVEPPSQQAERGVVAPNSPWPEGVLEVFNTAQLIRSYALGLFAGAGLPVELENGQARFKSPEETVGDLQAALRSLEARAEWAERGVAAELSLRSSAAARNVRQED